MLTKRWCYPSERLSFGDSVLLYLHLYKNTALNRFSFF